MEYRFRAKKLWNVPEVICMVSFAGILTNLPPTNIDHPLINIILILLCIIFIGFCYRELSQRVILTISDTGITYSGSDYIFAPKLENIKSEQLSKILIPNNEWLSFIERNFKPTICLISHHEEFIKNLDGQQWQPLSELNLEQALEACFKSQVELASRDKILSVVRKHQNNMTELGQVAGYFAWASIGLAFICLGLAFLDSYITIAWGQYKYMIWATALITAVICLVKLVRSKTHPVALIFVPLIFTAAMTFFIHQSLMLLNYYFGEQTSYRFEKVIQNKDYEMWRTATGDVVECKSSPRRLHDYQTAIVRIGILGVVRTSQEVCMSPQ